MKRSLIPLLALSAAAFADGPNIVVNGDFQKFTPTENLWDGVDSKNFLCGNRRGTYALNESGKVGNLDMPITVSFIDMNGDKLPDLVTCDPAGILRCYFNSGTKDAPKFTNAEVIPIFPPMVAKNESYDRSLWTWQHGVPKITMFDWNKRGQPDLIFGNYMGDVVMVPNTGSATSPAYAQPADYNKVRLGGVLGKRPWGNLFAPCAVDWNKDGKTDLLIGEGSYSANSIYVLLNQAAGSEPKFTEDQRYYLCYGDGREQLVPTVADYNGDGNLDVIVGDRKGTIGVYMNQGNWKPGQELPLGNMITFGNVSNFGQAVAPYAADYNGDGLFDLLIGKANGHIAVAINKGTPTEPKFDTPTDIMGTNIWGEDIRLPGTWMISNGNERANLYANVSVDDEKSPGGGKTMKCYYSPSPNKVFKMEELTVTAGKNEDDYFRYWLDEWVPTNAQWAGWDRTSNTFLIRQFLPPMKVGSTYQISFNVKGKGIRDGLCTVAYLGANENTGTKFAKAGRGFKVDKDETNDQIKEEEKFTSSLAWKKVEKTFTVHFKNKDIKKLDTTTLAMIEFKFELIQYLGDCEIADVSIVEKTKSP